MGRAGAEWEVVQPGGGTSQNPQMCVCGEEDLGLGKVSVVSGGASVLDFCVCVCAADYLFIHSASWLRFEKSFWVFRSLL